MSPGLAPNPIRSSTWAMVCVDGSAGTALLDCATTSGPPSTMAAAPATTNDRGQIEGESIARIHPIRPPCVAKDTATLRSTWRKRYSPELDAPESMCRHLIVLQGLTRCRALVRLLMFCA